MVQGVRSKKFFQEGQQTMKSYDFEAVTYDGDVYCKFCLPNGVNIDDEEVSPIFADSEWDAFPVCYICGEVHEYVDIIE